MADYEHKSIKVIINDINSKYFLPDIQRNFVWKKNQIYKLFDSLMRGYPINTLLFWEIDKSKSEEINKKYQVQLLKFISNGNNSEKNEMIKENEVIFNPYYLVLDGQQRLTSLNMALRGKFYENTKPKELYFNVIDNNEDTDELKFNFEFKYTNGDKEWINVKEIFNMSSKELGKFIDRYDDIRIKNRDKYDIIKENINSLYNIFNDNLYFYLEKETDYDKILDIFVRTNSGGTQLSYSDLLFSKIKLTWKDAKDEIDNLLDNINENNFKFNTDFVLKTFLFLTANKQDEIKFKIENFEQNRINLFVEKWKKIKSAVTHMKDVLENMGIKDGKMLSSNNALIPLVYYIYKNEIKNEEQLNKELLQIKNFTFSTLLAGTFGGQSDSILYNLKKIIDANPNEYPIIKMNKKLKELQESLDISDDFLLKIKYGSSNSHLILSILNPNYKFKASNKSNTVHQDHMFTQKELKENNIPYIETNSLGNLRYTTANDNLSRGATPYSDWIKTLTDEQRIKEFIPKGDFNILNYSRFLTERIKLIRLALETRLKL